VPPAVLMRAAGTGAEAGLASSAAGLTCSETTVASSVGWPKRAVARRATSDAQAVAPANPPAGSEQGLE